MSNEQHKNIRWHVTTITMESAQLCVLMDIRDELQKLNSLLHCPNFQEIPRKLDKISRNTAKPRKRKPLRKKAP